MKYFSFFLKKSLFCSIICILAFAQQTIIAQNNFVEATVITLNNDTLQGYIDYQNWIINPKTIRFKNAKHQTTIVTYTTNDLAEFYVDGEVYSRHISEVDKSPYIVDQLVPNAEPLLVVDTFFAQVLVSGTLSLYYLNDAQPKPHFFIKTADNKFRELINRVELKQLIDGTDGILTNEHYKKQLAFVMSDCPSANISFPTLSYTQRSLVKAFKKYNSCKEMNGQAQYQVQRTRKVKWRFGGTAGLSLTDLTFETSANIPSFRDLENTKFKMQPNIALALRLDAVFPRGRKRWRIINELMFRTHSSTGKFSVTEHTQDYRTGNITLSNTFLGINTMVRYQMPLAKIQPFINLGVGNSFVILKENQKYTSRYYWGIESQETKFAIESTRSYEQARFIGLGVARNQLNAEMRFVNGSGIEDFLLLKENSFTYALLFSYMF